MQHEATIVSMKLPEVLAGLCGFPTDEESLNEVAQPCSVCESFGRLLPSQVLLDCSPSAPVCWDICTWLDFPLVKLSLEVG